MTECFQVGLALQISLILVDVFVKGTSAIYEVRLQIRVSNWNSQIAGSVSLLQAHVGGVIFKLIIASFISDCTISIQTV